MWFSCFFPAGCLIYFCLYVLRPRGRGADSTCIPNCCSFEGVGGRIGLARLSAEALLVVPIYSRPGIALSKARVLLRDSIHACLPCLFFSFVSSLVSRDPAVLVCSCGGRGSFVFACVKKADEGRLLAPRFVALSARSPGRE